MFGKFCFEDLRVRLWDIMIKSFYVNSCEEEVDNKGAFALKETLKELKNLQKLNLAFHK